MILLLETMIVVASKITANGVTIGTVIQLLLLLLATRIVLAMIILKTVILLLKTMIIVASKITVKVVVGIE
jgi:hypothetical protein